MGPPQKGGSLNKSQQLREGLHSEPSEGTALPENPRATERNMFYLERGCSLASPAFAKHHVSQVCLQTPAAPVLGTLSLGASLPCHCYIPESLFWAPSPQTCTKQAKHNCFSNRPYFASSYSEASLGSLDQLQWRNFRPGSLPCGVELPTHHAAPR